MRFDIARHDTICACATAPGVAALALVRVSGRRAHDVYTRVFRAHRTGPMRPFVATRGDVIDAQGRVVDDGVCVCFPEGRSFTGEACFELTIHGGVSRVHATLQAIVHAGCRIAEPGEFTLRAVLNGRMDLVEAEAIHDVIHARSEAAARAALSSLRGGVSSLLLPVRTTLVDALAELEARLDFPDDDLGDAGRASVAASLAQAHTVCARLLASSSFGVRLAQGARVVLYGPPNAGKSTLLNALCGQERAIVHDSPGTTRDVLEHACEIDGVWATLVDVAGVRDDDDVHPVERMGIVKARAERERADVVVALLPATTPDVRAQLHALAPEAIHVVSKCDLVDGAMHDEVLAVSVHAGLGLAALRAAIGSRLRAGASVDEEHVLQNERQLRCVSVAADGLQRAREALVDALPDEIVCSELRVAARALDDLFGRDITEDVLEAVFTRFCIGK